MVSYSLSGELKTRFSCGMTHFVVDIKKPMEAVVMMIIGWSGDCRYWLLASSAGAVGVAVAVEGGFAT